MKTINPFATKEHEEHKSRVINDPLFSLRSMCSFAAKKNPLFSCGSCISRLTLLLISAFTGSPIQAQIQQAWVAHYNNGITNGTHQAVKMAMDSTGSIYVTGASQNTNGNLGYVTIKYAPDGTQLWASRYDSTNYPNATPSGLVLDKSNNVVITGSAGTIKYGLGGNQLWNASYAGTALAVDRDANIYVTGYSSNYNTVKLNSMGVSLWQASYKDVGPTIAQVIVIDTNNNIYIAGSDQYSEGYFDDYAQLITTKYDTNGNQIWVVTDDASPMGGFEIGFVNIGGLAVDGGGNLYDEVNFEGPDQEGYATFKYASNGSLLWVTTPPGNTASYDGFSTGMVLDNGTNVLLTGSVSYNEVIAYNQVWDLGYYDSFKFNSNGSLIWTNAYPTPVTRTTGGNNGGNAIAVDSANNVYVTGFSSEGNVYTNNDIVTIKYNSNGNQAWLERYNGSGNGNDVGNAIVVDHNENVYVTGYDTLPGGGTEIVTIKYTVPPIERLGNGDILLQAQGGSSENFDVMATVDFRTWQDLGISPADTNGFFQYTDTNAPQYTNRFYVTVPQ